MTALAIETGRSRGWKSPVEVAAAAPVDQGVTPGAVVASRPGRGGEAVEVYGHWMIEMRDPDGSLVRSVEFDNALTTLGARWLAQVLKGSHVITSRSIQLTPSGSNAPCRSGTNPTDCRILEPGAQAHPGSDFNNLAVSVPNSGVNRDKLVLSGTATAVADGDVGVVRVIVNFIDQEGGGPLGGALTEAIRQPPESVQAGQQIAVTVVISFR